MKTSSSCSSPSYPLPTYKNLQKSAKKLLHLRKFPVISHMRTNFAEMPGKTQHSRSRETKFKGDAVVRVSRLRRQT